MPAQATATHAAAARTAWRTPNAFVCSVPAATVALLCLMVRRGVGRETGFGLYQRGHALTLAKGFRPSVARSLRSPGHESSLHPCAVTPPLWRIDGGNAGPPRAARPRG